jgi:hypothetical protein
MGTCLVLAGRSGQQVPVMGDRHKQDAITFRDGELVAWVKQHAENTGGTATDLLRQIVADARAASEQPQEIIR